MTRAVRFVVPEGIDDASRVSGGNIYDRRISAGLRGLGWTVQLIPIAPSEHSARAALADASDGAIVLVDGLIAGRAPGVIEAEAERLRIVVLAHMVSAAFPDADRETSDGEFRALRAARLVITTSAWTRDEIVTMAAVVPDRVQVARPGFAENRTAAGTPSGRSLLCVGVVAPHKGQDLLVRALAALPGALGENAWTCAIAGSLDADPDFSARLADEISHAGLTSRVRLTGVLAPDALDAAYRAADLLVAPSRVESYGIALADGLGRGIPIIATRVGGIPEVLGPHGAGILVPPDDPRALGDALGRWMTDAALRARLTAQARRRRGRLPRWTDTARQVAAALQAVASERAALPSPAESGAR